MAGTVKLVLITLLLNILLTSVMQFDLDPSDTVNDLEKSFVENGEYNSGQISTLETDAGWLVRAKDSLTDGVEKYFLTPTKYLTMLWRFLFHPIPSGTFDLDSTDGIIITALVNIVVWFVRILNMIQLWALITWARHKVNIFN